MMKRMILGGLVLLLLCSMIACGGVSRAPSNEYKQYQETYYNIFDTIISVTVHTKSEAEGEKYLSMIRTRLEELDELYTTFRAPKEGTNLWTVNEMAGKEPVKVDEDIMNLLLFCQENYEKYSHKADITMGPVTALWHSYREGFIEGPLVEQQKVPAGKEAALPPEDELKAKKAFVGMEHLILDAENQTAYLDMEGASLDVGAVAKGYAVEVVVREAQDAGMTSGFVSAGGNVRTVGVPKAVDRGHWSIGIENPDDKERMQGKGIVDIVYMGEGALVTSGDYQRYYVVDGQTYHHLIDPDSLYPPHYCRSVTIYHPDSGLADFLSTACFLMEPEKGYQLIESIPEAEAYWVFEDKTTLFTPGMESMLESQGATP